MNPTLISLLQTLLPVYAICGLFYLWSRKSHSRPLAQLLKISAFFWAVWLAWCFAMYTYANAQCGGDWIYGLRDCTDISDEIAEMLMATAIFSFFAAIAYGAILALGGLLAEVYVRRRAARSKS